VACARSPASTSERPVLIWEGQASRRVLSAILFAMQKRTNRLIVAAVLIAAAVIGGFFVFTARRQAAAIDGAASDVASRIERMIATAGDLASAQQAYVAPGQPDQPWLARGAMLLQQFGQDAAAIRPLLQSSTAASALDDIEKHFKAVVTIDARVREELQQDQKLLAADLIFSEGHNTVSGLVMALGTLGASERQTFAERRAASERQLWEAAGAVAFVWLAGMIAMVPLPRSGIRPGSGVRNPGPGGSGFEGSRLDGSLPDPRSRIPDPGLRPRVDLTAAADVCGALARTSDTTALREALTHAAAVLDARGLIVWVGAGEELFPALSHGYDEQVVERLGAIPRNAANATAEAWRTAQMRTVESDQMFDGALAVPLVGINGCVGVLAAEVRNGGEADPATKAVAAMFAAQLAGIVPAWPAASSVPERADTSRMAASHQ